MESFAKWEGRFIRHAQDALLVARQFRGAAKLRHPMLNSSQLERSAASDNSLSGIAVYSVEQRNSTPAQGLAWGVLWRHESVTNGRGKRTKGAARLEGTLQGPGGTLQH